MVAEDGAAAVAAAEVADVGPLAAQEEGSSESTAAAAGLDPEAADHPTTWISNKLANHEPSTPDTQELGGAHTPRAAEATEAADGR